MSEKKLVPKLRFSGFDDGWESTKIGEIAEIVGGGTPKTEVEEYWNGEIKWFTPSEIGKTKYILDSERHITEEGLKNSSAKLLPVNTILLSSRATVGEISIALTECSTNQGFQSLITNNNVYNDFVYYLISTIKNEFIRRASGSTFLEISKNEIKRIPINIPSLSEQKKISDLFSTIDNKIEILQKKYQYYQDFKKYLMQQIFAQKLRFDFDEDWEIKKLDELSKVHRGASPRPISSKKWYDYENKKVGWVRIGDVTSSSKYLTKTEDYFSEEGVKKSRFLPKGSLIMSICATIGKPIITDIDTCIHDGFVGFSELKINKEFLYYYLNILEPKFIALSQTGSQANLNTDLVKISKISVPSLKEQEKIVDFLSFVDKKIELSKKQIETYVKFKKGLLQQLFV